MITGYSSSIPVRRDSKNSALALLVAGRVELVPEIRQCDLGSETYRTRSACRSGFPKSGMAVATFSNRRETDMSLKWFHVIFVGTSVLLSVVLAAWAVRHEMWLTALVALAGGSALILYRRTFLQKTRELED